MTTQRMVPVLTALALLAACKGDVDGGGATQSDGAAGASGAGGTRDGGGGVSGGGSGGRDEAGGSGGRDASVGSGGSGEMDGGGGTAGQSEQDSGMEDDAQVIDASSGETRLVIVGSGPYHNLALSIDEGLSWCLTNNDPQYEGQNEDNPHLLRKVTFANGWFVSGSWEALFRSRNGYEWEDVTGDEAPITGNWIAQMDFGNGWWVAAGGYGTVMRSMDMLVWEDVSDEMPGTEATRSLAFGNGVFVASRDGVGWWQSTDGTGWTQRDGSGGVYFDGTEFRTSPGYRCRGQLCFQNGANDTIMRSTDGGSTFNPTQMIKAAWGFAFGDVPVEYFGPSAAIDAEVRSCLGL